MVVGSYFDGLIPFPGEDESSDEDMELQAATPAEPKKELTPEERAQKLKELEELRIKKRAEREEREKQEAIEKEKIRVREGKNLTEIKQHMADKEIKLAAEERRREKEETRLAKERVRAQIEADKMARKKKVLIFYSRNIYVCRNPSMTPRLRAVFVLFFVGS